MNRVDSSGHEFAAVPKCTFRADSFPGFLGFDVSCAQQLAGMPVASNSFDVFVCTAENQD
ncbi:hypothetical protein SynBIOSE41_02113 [Synechococcus sp. BIOS-E4-1]|nr:hypothetical protein SynBIOSE41_02113 [Synechococcus sp. BIOS-E4-1]